jgi:hypothetical protein
MKRLSPQHIPVYETDEKRRQLWERCVDAEQPVVAIRRATRGYIVRYDLQHLDAELSQGALRRLRERTRTQRAYPTGGSGASLPETDSVSESEGIGGVAGTVSGDLHAHSEHHAREIASQLSTIIFDRSGWQ